MMNADDGSLPGCVIERHNRSILSTFGAVKPEIIYYSLYLHFWCSEVEKQTYLLPSGFKVVKALRFVDIFDCLHGFQLDKYISLYQ